MHNFNVHSLPLIRGWLLFYMLFSFIDYPLSILLRVVLAETVSSTKRNTGFIGRFIVNVDVGV